MNNYDKEHEICEAATDGPWGSYYLDDSEKLGERYFITDGIKVVCRIKNDTKDAPLDENDASNAKFIAHFNPTRVMELLEAEKERDELQRENEQLRIHYESEKRRADDRAAENEELRAHVIDMYDAMLVAIRSNDSTYAEDVLRDVIKKSPSQSLQALREEERRSIKAEIEEEVIERCLSRIGDKSTHPYMSDYDEGIIESRKNIDEYIRNMPRKYKGE